MRSGSRASGGPLRALAEVCSGLSLLLGLAAAASLAGLGVQQLDGAYVVKVVALPLGPLGVLAWAAMLVLESVLFGGVARLAWLAATAPSALAALLGYPHLLALQSAAGFLAARPAGGLLASLLLAEALNGVYLLGSVFGFYLPPAGVGYAVHLSMLAVAAPLVPLLILLMYASPLLAPLARLRGGGLGLPEGRVMLYAALLASLLTWLLVYYSPVSPGGLVGVDARYYLEWTSRALAEGPVKMLRYGDRYDRPLYMLFLYSLALAVGPEMAVRLALLVCMVLYVSAVYLLISVLAGRRLAGLASLLAALSYTTTSGVFAAYYANWTSTSLALLAAALALEWVDRPRRWPLVALLVVAYTAVHVYMALLSTAAIAMMLVYGALSPGGRRSRILLAIMVVAAYLAALKAFDAAAAATGLALAKGATASVTQLINAWRRALPSIFTSRWWGGYLFAVYNYMACASLEPLEWILAALAGLGARGRGRALTLSWLAVTGVLVLTAPSSSLMHRSLFALPVSVLEALGLEAAWRPREGEGWLALLLAYRANYTLAFLLGLLR